MTRINAISWIFGLALLTGCVNPNEDVMVHSMNGTWPVSEPQVFHFDIDHSENAKNIIFVVRNNSQYPYHNLKVKVTLRMDSTRVLLNEQVDMRLAEKDGHWLGTGFGDTKELLFNFKTEYRFPQNGPYTLEVSPMMVRQPLRGIEDFGINIQTAH